jgi:hypothetical protein
MPTKDYRELIIESRKYGRFTVLYDAEDEDLIAQKTWGVIRNHSMASRRTNYNLYVYTTTQCVPEEWVINATDGGRRRKRKTLLLHRQILCAKKGEVVDHINGNPLDNRRENLHITTLAGNAQNKIKQNNNKTGYIGVYFEEKTGRYYAQIWCDRKRRCIGTFDAKEEAAEMRDRKACELWDIVNPERQLNFPERYEEYMAELED